MESARGGVMSLAGPGRSGGPDGWLRAARAGRRWPSAGRRRTARLGAGLLQRGRLLLALPLLVACAGGEAEAPRDPKLDSIATRLSTWERGKAALDAGDTVAARAAFAEARASAPDDTTLVLWEARAAAAAGDLDGALALLDQTVSSHPGASAAWYNRAAYRARQGRLEEAAADLRVALDAGVTSPWAATLDPDFAPHRADPAFAALLPAAPLSVTATGPDGAVFLGGTVEITLMARGLATPRPSLTLAPFDAGCLTLRELVEDGQIDGDTARWVITLRFDTKGPCRASLGPFTLTGAGGVPAESGVVPVVVEAPEGAVVGAPAPLPRSLPLPGTLFAANPGRQALRVPGGVAALAGADEELSATRGGSPVAERVKLELRVSGQTRARGAFWPGEGAVSVRSGEWTAEVE